MKYLAVLLAGLLVAGCTDPFGISDDVRQRLLSNNANPTLTISDDGGVFARGTVTGRTDETFKLAGATFKLSADTEVLDAQGRSLTASDIVPGLLLEVDGVEGNGGDILTTYAEIQLTSDAATDDDEGDESVEKVVICHIPPGNPANARTKDVGASALAAHLAHGDHEGECTGEEGDGVRPGLGDDDDEGDDAGDGDEDEEGDDDDDGEEGETVVICHIPPGNPDAAHTIEIGVDALDAHIGHGDYGGPCQNETGG